MKKVSSQIFIGVKVKTQRKADLLVQPKTLKKIRLKIDNRVGLKNAKQNRLNETKIRCRKGEIDQTNQRLSYKQTHRFDFSF